MEEPINLHLFDLEHFQEIINRHLAYSDEGGLSLRNPERENPRKDPFPRLNREETFDRIKYRVHHETFGRPGGFFGIASEPRVGYLFVESGRTQQGIGYEALKLELKEMLERRDNRIIPACTVKIIAESQGGGALYSEPQRTDHVRTQKALRGRWKKSDLTDVLPTQWFFNGDIFRPK